MAIESKMKGPLGRRPIGSPRVEEKKKPWSKIISVIIVILVLGGALYGASTLMGGSDNVTGSQSNGDYQAVFLDNGQVYFGKLVSKRGDFWRLENVYYLDLGNNPQSGGLEAGLSLVKLGNEAHAPQDFMQINKEHVLFYEDLKSEGKVMSAISDYLGKN